MKNILKNLFLGLLIFLLLFPRPASADFLGIMDAITAALEGVEETVLPILQQAIRFLFLYVIGIILLVTSGTLFQHVITHQAAWISVQPAKNALVASGFAFTSGLANLLLILIFIVIAFAFIFKIETFQLKKTLFKLIAVALLLNFSLVFIGMALDVTNIIYSTILDRMTIKQGETTDQNQAERSLLVLTIERLLGPVWQQLLTMMAWIGALAVAFSIPFGGAIAQLAIATGFQILFLPNILIWVSQLICSFLLSGIFFLYTFLFISRAFIIPFLAILSPLAFLSLILPQTEKYWKEWLSHFLQWLFLGIFLLFFLVLGLRAIEKIQPPGSIGATRELIPGVAWVHVDEFFVYYFSLFIYLLIVGWLAKRTMPALAETLIAGATSWGKLAWGRVIRPMAGAMGKEVRKAWVEPGKPGGFKERAKKWAEAPAPEVKAEGGKLRKAWAIARTTAALPLWAVRREVGKQLALAPVEAERREIESGKKRAEEIKTPELALAEIRGALAARDSAKALGLLSKTIERGGGFKKLIEKELRPEEAIRLAQYANKIGVVKEARRMVGTLSKEKFQRYPDLLKRMGFKEFEDLTPEEQEEWKAKGYETALDKLVREATEDEIKYFNRKFFEIDEVMENVIEWNVSQLATAAKEFRKDFVDRYMEVTEKLIADIGVEEYVRRNPDVALYLARAPAQMLGFRAPAGLTIEDVRRIRRGGEERRRIPFE